MKFGRLSMKLFLITLTCFLLSYASSVLGNLNSEKSFPHSLFTQYTRTIGSSQSVEIEKNIESSEITEIEIQSTQTDIEIRAENVKQISIGLKGHYISKINHPESALQVTADGSKLYIKTNENEFDESAFFHISSNETDGKMIVVAPLNIKKVKIKTVSGDVIANNLKLSSLWVESVSGDTLLSQNSLDELQFKSVSGGLAGSGAFLQVQAKSVSGGIKLTFSNNNPVIDFKSTSGDIQTFFSAQPDLNIQFSTISGDFELDPNFGKEQTRNSKIQLVLGNGLGKVSVKTISGDFKVGRVDKID